MPVQPAIAEDLLALLDKYPDLTLTQKAIGRSAAAFLVQDALVLIDDEPPGDSRLQMGFDEYNLLPNRLEAVRRKRAKGA